MVLFPNFTRDTLWVRDARPSFFPRLCLLSYLLTQLTPIKPTMKRLTPSRAWDSLLQTHHDNVTQKSICADAYYYLSSVIGSNDAVRGGQPCMRLCSHLAFCLQCASRFGELAGATKQVKLSTRNALATRLPFTATSLTTTHTRVCKFTFYYPLT